MGYSLFTSQVPVNGNQSDGTPGITTATTIMFSEPGFITHFRFYSTATLGPSDAYKGMIYRVTGPDDVGLLGAHLQTVDFSSGIVVPSSWNEIELPSKVPVVPGTGYRSCLFTGTSGRYVASNHLFDTGTPIANGPVFAPEHGSDPFGFGVFRQGTFEVNADPTYPNEEFQASCYFVDVVFEPKKHSKGAEFLSFF